MVAEFHERAVKALDVCNAARDGVDQVRRWERLANIAAYVLRGPADIQEGQLRRARKALSDPSGLLVNDTAASGCRLHEREHEDITTRAGGRGSRFRRCLTCYSGGAEEAGAQWRVQVSCSTEYP
jgi:hypothetical protein